MRPKRKKLLLLIILKILSGRPREAATGLRQGRITKIGIKAVRVRGRRKIGLKITAIIGNLKHRLRYGP